MTTVEPPRTRRNGATQTAGDGSRGAAPDPRRGEGPRRRPAAGPGALAALRGLVQDGAAQRTAGAALRGLAQRVAPTDDPAVTAQVVELDEDGAPRTRGRGERAPAPRGMPWSAGRRGRTTAPGAAPAPVEPAPARPLGRPSAARPPAPIDPRFKARRVAVRRTEGRKRLRVLTAVGVVVAGLLTAYGLSRSAVLDVDRITIVGVNQVNPDFVLAAAGVAVGDPILYTDLGAVADRIERLPWVSDAVVTRSLPGDLMITVTERAPVAWIGLADGTALGVDAQGIAIGIVGGPRDGMVEIEFSTPPPAALGEPIPEATGAAAYAAELASGRHDLAARGGLVRITVGVPPAAATTPAVDPVTGAPVPPTADLADAALDASGSGLDDAARVAALSTHVAHLGDGSEIRLGDGTEVAAKLEALETVLEYLGAQPFRYVDVAVPASPAVGVLPPIDAGEDEDAAT
jgi:cell division septal protein FtsQ